MINTSRSRIIVIVTLALALVAAIIAIGLGSVYIPIPDILSTIFGSAAKAVNATIIWDIRLPRVLLAMIIGANIAVSGALLQAVMGNPLADPGLLGVTSGAAAWCACHYACSTTIYGVYSNCGFCWWTNRCRDCICISVEKNGISPIILFYQELL